MSLAQFIRDLIEFLAKELEKAMRAEAKASNKKKS